MGIAITGTFSRGADNTSTFVLVDSNGVPLHYRLVADNAARDALAEYLRVPYMLIHSIGANATYRLGSDVTIGGQVWAEESGDFIPLTQKGANSGVAPLNSSGKIDIQYLDTITLSSSFAVVDINAMLALTTYTGNVVVVIDATDDPSVTPGQSASYVKSNDVASPVLADFLKLETGAAVSAVNGEIGAVDIDFTALLAWGASQTQFDVAVAAHNSVTTNAGDIITNALAITDLDTNKANIIDVLLRNNGDVYVPSGDYNPATKKYVDDAVGAGHFVPSTLLADYGFTDNSGQWNSAYNWGDHAAEGYVVGSFTDNQVGVSDAGGDLEGSANFTWNGITLILGDTQSQANLQFTVSDTNGATSSVSIRKGANLRWVHGMEGTSEAGSDSGSDYWFRRWSDAGTYLGDALILKRDDGQLVLPSYGTGAITGSATKTLAVDIDGNVIETALSSAAGNDNEIQYNTGGGFDSDPALAYNSSKTWFNMDETGSHTALPVWSLTMGDDINTIGVGTGRIQWSAIFGDVFTFDNVGTTRDISNVISTGTGNTITIANGAFGVYSSAFFGSQLTIEPSLAGTNYQGSIIGGTYNTSRNGYQYVGGQRADVLGIGAFVHGQGENVNRLFSDGNWSINMSINTVASTYGEGANAISSAIIGGQDHHIPSDSPRSAIIGGNALKMPAATPDTVMVQNLIFTNDLRDSGSTFFYDQSKSMLVAGTGGANPDFTGAHAQSGSWSGIFGEDHTFLAGRSVNLFVSGWKHTIGDDTNSAFSGAGSIITGSWNHVADVYSTAMGYGVKALGYASIAWGSGYDWGGSGQMGDHANDRWLVASGDWSINMSNINGNHIEGEGALATSSVIIGGRNHNIPADSPRSVIIGGDRLLMPAATPDTVLVENLLATAVRLDGGGAGIGELTWNAVEDTVDLAANGVTYQIGQEISPLVRNNTGSTITNGTPVMFVGTLGASGRILVAPAIADGSIPSSYALGTATQDILNGQDGHVTWFGKVRDIDTSGTPYGETWNDSDILYVSPTTAGYLTNVKPQAPDLQIFIGVVVNAHSSNGTIFVRASWRGSLIDLDDVNGTALTTDGQIATWHQTEQYFDFDDNINNYVTTVDADASYLLNGGTSTLTASTIIDGDATYGIIIQNTPSFVATASTQATIKTVDGGGNAATVLTAISQISIQMGVSGQGSKQLLFTNSTSTGIMVIDQVGDSGFYYQTDYSGTQQHGNRWIPDKEYVDSVAGGGWELTGTTTLTGAVDVQGGADEIRLSGSALVGGIVQIDSWLSIDNNDLGTHSIELKNKNVGAGTDSLGGLRVSQSNFAFLEFTDNNDATKTSFVEVYSGNVLFSVNDDRVTFDGVKMYYNQAPTITVANDIITKGYADGAYEVPLTFSEGLTRTVNNVTLGDTDYQSDILIKSLNESTFYVSSQNAGGTIYSEIQTTGASSSLASGNEVAGDFYSGVFASTSSGFGESSIFVENASYNRYTLSLHTTNGAIFTDAINSGGLQYAADYSTYGAGTIGDRWILDKGFADGAYIKTAGSSTLTGATTTNRIILPSDDAAGLVIEMNNPAGGFGGGEFATLTFSAVDTSDFGLKLINTGAGDGAKNPLFSYGGDYSGDYDNRSLVDKEYVDNQSVTYTSGNGISVAGSVINLGNTLTSHVSLIPNAPNTLAFSIGSAANPLTLSILYSKSITTYLDPTNDASTAIYSIVANSANSGGNLLGLADNTPVRINTNAGGFVIDDYIGGTNAQISLAPASEFRLEWNDGTNLGQIWSNESFGYTVFTHKTGPSSGQVYLSNINEVGVGFAGVGSYFGFSPQPTSNWKMANSTNLFGWNSSFFDYTEGINTKSTVTGSYYDRDATPSEYWRSLGGSGLKMAFGSGRFRFQFAPVASLGDEHLYENTIEFSSTGATYASDYSGDHTSDPRWIPDKGYTDNNYIPSILGANYEVDLVASDLTFTGDGDSTFTIGDEYVSFIGDTALTWFPQVSFDQRGNPNFFLQMRSTANGKFSFGGRSDLGLSMGFDVNVSTNIGQFDNQFHVDENGYLGTDSLLNAATGNEIGLDFQVIVNKLTSGSYTGLKLNVTETDVNADNLLMDLQVDTVSKFSVSSIGGINVADRIGLGLTVGDVATPTEGQIWYNDTTNKFRAFENAAAVDMIGGGGSQTPWTGNIDGATFNVTNAGNWESELVGGGAVLNETTSGSNPTLLPYRGAPTSGIGLKLGGSGGVAIINSGLPLLVVGGTGYFFGDDTVGGSARQVHADGSNASGVGFIFNNEISTKIGAMTSIKNVEAASTSFTASANHQQFMTLVGASFDVEVRQTGTARWALLASSINVASNTYGSGGSYLLDFRGNSNAIDIFQVSTAGAIHSNAYGGGTETGTATYMLAVDASGNIIEEALPSGGSSSGVINTIQTSDGAGAFVDSGFIMLNDLDSAINQHALNMPIDINQDSTEGYTIFNVAVTETTTGSGNKALMFFSVDAATKYHMRSTGDQIIYGDIILGTGGELIRDGDENELLGFTEVTSAVNYIQITNAITATGPIIASVGDNSDIDLILTPKGTGNLVAVTDELVLGDSAETGTTRTISAAGSGANIGLKFEAKGSNNFTFTDNGVDLFIKGTSASDFTIASGGNSGLDLILHGADSTGAGDGGEMLIRGGTTSSGIAGDVVIEGGEQTFSGTHGVVIVNQAGVEAAKFVDAGVQLSGDTTQVIKTSHVQLSQAQIKAASSVTLIAAPGTGKYIKIIGATAFYDHNGTDYTGGVADLTIENGDMGHVCPAIVSETADMNRHFNLHTVVSGNSVDLNDIVTVKVDATTTDDGGTIDVYVQYVEINTN